MLSAALSLALLFVSAGCTRPGAAEVPAAPASEVPPAAAVQSPVPVPPPSPVCPKPELVQSPITWNAEREALTVAYRGAHQATPQGTAQIAPKMVVLHWTGGSTFSGAFNTFDGVRLSGRPNLAEAGALNVSAHFLVDQDGTIHQLLPVTTMARHVIGLNHIAIGVENVGGAKGVPLTDSQAQANIALVCWLSTQQDLSHLIGHHEYRQMEGSALFDEVDPSYRTAKIDPGDAFMAQVRGALEEKGVVLSGPDGLAE